MSDNTAAAATTTPVTTTSSHDDYTGGTSSLRQRYNWHYKSPNYFVDTELCDEGYEDGKRRGDDRKLIRFSSAWNDHKLAWTSARRHVAMKERFVSQSQSKLSGGEAKEDSSSSSSKKEKSIGDLLNQFHSAIGELRVDANKPDLRQETPLKESETYARPTPSSSVPATSTTKNLCKDTLHTLQQLGSALEEVESLAPDIAVDVTVARAQESKEASVSIAEGLLPTESPAQQSEAKAVFDPAPELEPGPATSPMPSPMPSPHRTIAQAIAAGEPLTKNQKKKLKKRQRKKSLFNEAKQQEDVHLGLDSAGDKAMKEQQFPQRVVADAPKQAIEVKESPSTKVRPNQAASELTDSGSSSRVVDGDGESADKGDQLLLQVDFTSWYIRRRNWRLRKRFFQTWLRHTRDIKSASGEIVVSRSELKRADTPEIDLLREQLESLMRDKTKLKETNSSLMRENLNLQELLSFHAPPRPETPTKENLLAITFNNRMYSNSNSPFSTPPASPTKGKSSQTVYTREDKGEEIDGDGDGNQSNCESPRSVYHTPVASEKFENALKYYQSPVRFQHQYDSSDEDDDEPKVPKLAKIFYSR